MNGLFEDKINNEKSNGEEKEKYILFAVSQGDQEKTDRSLDELEELLETAGGICVARMIQNLDLPDRSTYLGKGKAAELKELMDNLEADAILCDDELTPVQHRNLAELLDAKVVDRTMLILDIFAERATTREGKIQVEMAQLKYRASRLTGRGTALSRLGGGIGTRGPGETKLESDRRAIRRRMDSLSAQIKSMERVRETTGKKRRESDTPVIAIVGYTNAGKSTLLNRLTDSDILAEDKLFATLDPTTRVCILPGGQEVMMTDTVGFINKLPHHLVESFKSTLEEAKKGDIILHVIDGTSDERDLHRQVVYETLKSLGIKNKPIITAYNKMDMFSEKEDAVYLRDEEAEEVVLISARTGEGLDRLFSGLEKIIRNNREYIEEIIPYSNARRISLIRRYGELLEEEYLEDGIMIKAYVPRSIK